MYNNKPREVGADALIAAGLDWLQRFWRTLLSGGKADRVPRLDLTRRHRPDYWIALLTLLLATIGYVAMFSILPAITHGNNDQSNAYMLKQLAFLAVGVVAFVAATRLPLDVFRRYGARLFVAALVISLALPLLGLLHVPIARCALGACRWYRLGPLGTFQPAELLKLGAVLFTANILATEARRGRLNSWDTVWQVLVVLMLVMFVVVLLQKDLGTGVAFVGITLIELVVSGMRWKYVSAAALIILVAGVASIIVAPHRLQRIFTFVGSGTEETNYHINQAILALGSGGMFGRGLGKSVQAFGWLPEAVNDSIFAIWGEMIGWIGSVGLIVLFAGLLYIIIRKVDYLENYYLRLVLGGIFGWLAAHVLMNIGAMTHMIPLTGITLPLVSIGGTSLVFIMLVLGMVLNISRYTTYRRVHNNGEEERDEDFVRGRRQRRPYYTNRRGY